MTGLLRAVRAEVPGTCILEERRRCEKDGCGILFGDAPKPCLIIDLDEEGSPLGRQQRRCDYLFVADAAEKVVPENITVGFCPVAVGPAHKEEMYKLRKKDVSFCGRGRTVRSVRCGGRFTVKLCA